MKIFLWEIGLEPYRLAKFQWILFRLFKYKHKNPCGHTKHSREYYCHQPLDLKHCKVINNEKKHEVVCKCCGNSHMSSNQYIDPYDEKQWFTW